MGVITSPTGAAVRDIINVCTRRFPYAEIILYPALVQGEEAEPSLIDGINFFSLSKRADVVIIGRGGGSIEDLWAFNGEKLARAVYECSVPVISAVGHETDYTICDFVADLRAPTPSAAAELAVPDTMELVRKIGNVESKMRSLLAFALDQKKQLLGRMVDSYVFKSPSKLFDQGRLRIDMLSDRLDNAVLSDVALKQFSLNEKISKLEALSPLAVLSRGYTAVYSDGKVVKSADSVKSGDNLRLVISDGEINARVSSVNKTYKHGGNYDE